MIDSLNHIARVWWDWMWATTWQVSMLILVIWLVDSAIRKWVWPQVRYVLWLMVVVKLLLPPTFYLPTSITAQFGPAAIVQQVEDVVLRQPSEVELSATAPPKTVSAGAVPAVTSPRSASDGLASRSSEAGRLRGPRPRTSAPLSVRACVMVIWLMCVLSLAAYLRLRLRRLCSEALSGSNHSPPAWFPQLLAETSARLRLQSLPRVVVSRNAASPAVFGAFRPILLLPQDGLTRLSRQRAEHVLLHELAHIKRGDLIVHALFLLVQLFYWFNPLLWLVRRRLQHLRELCCDATVANLLRENTADYRQTLLETARQLLAEKAAAPGLGLLGIGEDGNSLRERLHWLERKTWKHAQLRRAVAVLTAAMMSACVLPMATAQIGQTNQASLDTDAGGASQSEAKDADRSAGHEEQLQALVQRLNRAILQDDRGAVAGMLSDNQRAGNVLEDLQEAIRLGATPAAIQTVLAAEGRALVITDFFEFADSRYRGKQCLIYAVRDQSDEWLIEDIDLESVEGLIQTVRRFDETQSRALTGHHQSIGLEGFCPVALTETGDWRRGDRRWGAVHKGRTYLFAERDHQQRFLFDPEAFAPAFAGCDPVAFAESGVLVDGTRQHRVQHEGTLFLFVDDSSKSKFEAGPAPFLRVLSTADFEEAFQGRPPSADQVGERDTGNSEFARWLSAAQAASLASFEELVREVIESRKAIQRGQIKYTQFTTGKSNSIVRYTVWFDGQSRRVDMQPLGGEVSTEIVTPEYGVRRRAGKTAAVSHPGGFIGNIPDPLRFGLVPWFTETAAQFEYDALLLNPKRKNVHVEVGSLGQATVWQVSYQMPAKGKDDATPVTVEYQLSPKQGNLPLRIATRYTDQNGKTYRKSIDCDLRKFPDQDVWFPARIAFRLQSGSETQEQVVTVNSARFNDRMDADIFLGKGLFAE